MYIGTYIDNFRNSKILYFLKIIFLTFTYSHFIRNRDNDVTNSDFVKIFAVKFLTMRPTLTLI